MAVAVVVGVTLISFFAGLLSFKVKSRWCPHCGCSTLEHRPPTDGAGGRHA